MGKGGEFRASLLHTAHPSSGLDPSPAGSASQGLAAVTEHSQGAQVQQYPSCCSDPYPNTHPSHSCSPQPSSLSQDPDSKKSWGKTFSKPEEDKSGTRSSLCPISKHFTFPLTCIHLPIPSHVHPALKNLFWSRDIWQENELNVVSVSLRCFCPPHLQESSHMLVH